MRWIVTVVLLAGCMPIFAANDKPATEATLQSVNSKLQAIESDLQTVNSNLSALNSDVQRLTNEIRNDYGGLEYVLIANIQAFYFGLGLALFYVFDRGRIARDVW